MGALTFIEWIIAFITNIFVMLKALVETKKLVEETVMPDIIGEEKIEEIKQKQELARNLVAMAGVQAAYNTARGLVMALLFGLVFHYAYKFTTAITRPKNKE